MAREIDVERWKRQMRTLKRKRWNLDAWTSCFLGLLGGAIFTIATADDPSKGKQIIMYSALIGLAGAALVSYFRHKGEADQTNATIEAICKDIDEVVAVTNEQSGVSDKTSI